MPKRFEVVKADPHRFIYGDERFSVQNMLIRQVNFPAYYHQGDFIFDQYTDRMYETVHAANEKYPGKIEDLSSEDFVQYCREACGVEQQITGARIVRFTNVSSGYPCDRIDLYCRVEGNPEVPVYSGNDAPNVNQPERKRHQGYGNWSY